MLPPRPGPAPRRGGLRLGHTLSGARSLWGTVSLENSVWGHSVWGNSVWGNSVWGHSGEAGLPAWAPDQTGWERTRAKRLHGRGGGRADTGTRQGA